MICGGLTGCLYKSTLGLIPATVGGILGATMIGAMTLMVE